jgi:hypothetical protein
LALPASTFRKWPEFYVKIRRDLTGTVAAFGELSEWRLSPQGQPYAAIIRTWESSDSDDPVA